MNLRAGIRARIMSVGNTVTRGQVMGMEIEMGKVGGGGGSRGGDGDGVGNGNGG